MESASPIHKGHTVGRHVFSKLGIVRVELLPAALGVVPTIWDRANQWERESMVPFARQLRSDQFVDAFGICSLG